MFSHSLVRHSIFHWRNTPKYTKETIEASYEIMSLYCTALASCLSLCPDQILLLPEQTLRETHAQGLPPAACWGQP